MGISKSSRRAEGRGIPFLCALGVLLAGLLLTLIGSRAIGAADEARAHERFRQSAAQATASVEGQLKAYFDRVRNVGAFVASGRHPTTAELGQYLEQDRTFQELPSLQSLIFVSRVEPAALDAARAGIQAAHPDALPDPGLIPHAGDAYYLVTDYVPGPSDYALPVGADLSGLTTVRALVDDSARTGSGVIASFQNDPLIIAAAKANPATPIQDVLDIDFILSVPIFDGSGQIGIDHLVGWVGAPVAHFAEVLEAASANRPADISQSLTVDVRAPGADGSVVTTASAHVGAEGGPDPEFTETQRVSVLGVDFTLRTWSTTSASADRASLATLVLGTFTSLLAAAVVFLRMRANQGRRAMVVALEDLREFEHAIVESVDSAMVVLDHDGVVVMGNRPWSELAVTDAGGRPTTTDDGPYLRRLAPASADVAGQLASGLDDVLAGEHDSVEMDVPVDRHGDRRWYSVRVTPLSGRDGGAVVMHTDVTERHRSADDLQRRASRDGLTGVLNRSSLESRADDLVAEAVRGGFPIGVLFIDLDDFKSVNDTYGHLVGDGVLRAAAAAIERTVRPGDSIGRMGGDEFVVLLGAGVAPHEIDAIAARLVFELSIPRTIEGIDVTIAASVGIALVDDPRTVDRAELIRRADEAMYVAKQSGGSQFVAADV